MPIKSVDYSSVISPFALVDIHSLSREYQWVAECHTERHAGSERPPMTNVRKDRYIVVTLQNRL